MQKSTNLNANSFTTFSMDLDGMWFGFEAYGSGEPLAYFIPFDQL